MVSKKSKNETRQKRHLRLRKNIIGSATCPRLVVFKSNANIYAQIIDDSKGVTLVAASSIDKELKLENGSNIAAAAQVGELVGKRAVKAGIETVVFDRGGYLYHGRVKALADAAREAGLRF